MSCPNWNALLAHRDSEPNLDPDAWVSAMEHLESCDLCRQEAFSAEPSLLFQDLPSLSVEADDVATMKSAVAAMRRAEPLQAAHPPRRRFLPALRAAALAALVLSLAGLQGGVEEGPEAHLGNASAVSATKLSAHRPAVISAPVRSAHPLIENVQTLSGTMVQMVDSELDVVLLISDDLDV